MRGLAFIGIQLLQQLWGLFGGCTSGSEFKVLIAERLNFWADGKNAGV